MNAINLLRISGENGLDRTNIKIGRWRILAVFLFGLGYFIFYSRGQGWILYWLAWLFYAALWLPFQGRYTRESPNAWTYFFMVGDVLFFLLATGIESDPVKQLQCHVDITFVPVSAALRP